MAVSSGLIVVDIGNTRVKSGEVDCHGSLSRTWAVPLDQPGLWNDLWRSWNSPDCPPGTIAVSSVNPQLALQFESFLERLEPKATSHLVWYRSAADVPVSRQIANPEMAGADRALAVAAAMGLIPEGRPGLVVCCGTAITVERITPSRVWQGGAITVGLGLAARALRQNTAQLPAIEPNHMPPAWGNSTRPSMEAGVYWGVVGAVRELLAKQRDDLPGNPKIIWTGGDAPTLANVIQGTDAHIAPHLVLEGLIHVSNIGRIGHDR